MDQKLPPELEAKLARRAARERAKPLARPFDTPSWWRDPATIPPREFLYGRHYVSRSIGATIAAGGRCKTTQSIYEAVSMASGLDLATGKPLEGGALRPWLLNGEEDQDELDRRIAATCKHYRITEADLGGRLFAESVRDKPLRVATIGKGGVPVLDTSIIDGMIQFAGSHRIDVFMLDPLISFHSVLESDNGHMDALIKEEFGAVAGKTNSAGELFHHPGKPRPGQAETQVEDGRGASAIIWAVRSARVMNFMTPAEADKLGMTDEERKLHIRIANGKANMAPLGKAEWIKIEVENLPNGDEIAVSSPWKPPNPFENVTTADVELAVRLAATGEYRADRRSPKWIGYAIAESLHLDVTHNKNNDPKDIAKLKTIIETWLKNNVFSIEERKDDDGRPRKFIVSNPARQGNRAAQPADDPEDLFS